MTGEEFAKAHANLTSTMVNDLLREEIKSLIASLEREWDCEFIKLRFVLTTTAINDHEEHVEIEVATQVRSRHPVED